jgi:hypothetical protein
MKRAFLALATLVSILTLGVTAPLPARATEADVDHQLALAEIVATYSGIYRVRNGKTPVPVFLSFSAGQGWASFHGIEVRMVLHPGNRLSLGGDRGTVSFRWRRLPVRPGEGFRFRLELTMEGAKGEKLVLESPRLGTETAVKGSFCLQQGTGGRWSSGVRSETWWFDGRGGATMSATESFTTRGYSGSVDTGDVPGRYRIDGNALNALIKAPGLRTFQIQRDRAGQVTALVSGKHRYLPCGRADG